MSSPPIISAGGRVPRGTGLMCISQGLLSKAHDDPLYVLNHAYDGVRCGAPTVIREAPLEYQTMFCSQKLHNQHLATLSTYRVVPLAAGSLVIAVKRRHFEQKRMSPCNFTLKIRSARRPLSGWWRMVTSDGLKSDWGRFSKIRARLSTRNYHTRTGFEAILG